MGWRLYLDDDADGERPPHRTIENPAWRLSVGLGPVPPSLEHLGDWLVARSGDEARELIARLGFPEFVAFDHDLGEGGDAMEIVDMLIGMDLDEGSMPAGFAYEVHSKNPVGRGNIVGRLESYLAVRRRDRGMS